jgi:hypothetical protein
MSTAATITKDVAYTGQRPRNTQPRAAEPSWIAIPINFPDTAPVGNDTHALTKLLPGVKVADWFIDLDDVDSNGSPAADLTLGELSATLADISVTYKSGITIGQTGGVLRMSAASAATGMRAIQAATLANERVIGLKWATAAATYATGKKGVLYLLVHY